jgi:hypothetical protein
MNRLIPLYELATLLRFKKWHRKNHERCRKFFILLKSLVDDAVLMKLSRLCYSEKLYCLNLHKCCRMNQLSDQAMVFGSEMIFSGIQKLLTY